MVKRVRLKPRRDTTVRRRHPWIFSGAVLDTKGDPEPGEIVEVRDARGRFLAWGYYNADSQIRIRALDWDPSSRIDRDWWRRRLERAINARAPLFRRSSLDAFRLVYSEADLLPGLIVDRYGEFLVLQALTAGIDRVKRHLAEDLYDLLRPRGVFERSDARIRALEGLELRTGVLLGEEPPEWVEIQENGYRFLADIRKGQKTGFFLDQRTNRQAVAGYGEDREVLDCFSFTGGFSVYLLGAGARSVTRVEISPGALSLGSRNLALNRLQDRDGEPLEGDVFALLRTLRDQGRSFDLVVLDPPKFAHSRAKVGQALRGYKDINLLALKLLRRDGILATFSCSGTVSLQQFREMVAAAAVDAGCHVQILESLGHGLDHPVSPFFPESDYLKGMICRVL